MAVGAPQGGEWGRESHCGEGCVCVCVRYWSAAAAMDEE